MRIGTTPTHQFEVPIDVNTISTVEVTYCQNRQVILQLDTPRCTLKENMISVTLTQKETFLFNPNVNVEIQIRVVDANRGTLSSDIMCVSADRCLSNEVLE